MMPLLAEAKNTAAPFFLPYCAVMARFIFAPFLLSGMARLQSFDSVIEHFVDADAFHGAATVRADLDVAACLRATGQVNMIRITNNSRRYKPAHNNNRPKSDSCRRMMHPAFWPDV